MEQKWETAYGLSILGIIIKIAVLIEGMREGLIEEMREGLIENGNVTIHSKHVSQVKMDKLITLLKKQHDLENVTKRFLIPILWWSNYTSWWILVKSS
jgi:hypothetical protein